MVLHKDPVDMFCNWVIMDMTRSAAYLNFFVSEGQKEPLAVLCSQSINTSGIDCTGQIVIHFLLCVFLIVSTWTNSKSRNIQK